MHQNQRGLLIVFEGLDRCGKTTQSSLLLKHLDPHYVEGESKIVVHQRFPDRTIPSGKQIDDYLNKRVQYTPEEIHKLYAQNRKECKEKLLDLLNSGVHLVIDRYAYSGVAYSVANGLDMDWCKPFDSGLPKPDIVFYINMTEDDVASRAGFGNERFEKKEFQKKVREAYEKLREPEWKIIPGTLKLEEVSEQIRKITDDFISKLNAKEILPLKELW